MSEAPTLPEPGHNKPVAEGLLAEVKHSLDAHSRHSSKAIEELHSSLAAVMRTCEYAHKNDETRKEVELALYHAKVDPPEGREWYRAIICSAYSKSSKPRKPISASGPLRCVTRNARA